MRKGGHPEKRLRQRLALDIGNSLPFPPVIAFASLKPVSASLRLLDIQGVPLNGYTELWITGTG